MGFLDELDLENVEDDPNAFPDGTYNAYVSDAKIVKVKNETEKRLVITYKLADGIHKGKILDEWKNVDKTAPPRDLSYLKSRLKSLGVPEEKFKTMDPGDLKGIAVRISKKTSGTFKNVTNVVLGHSGDATPVATNVLDDAPAAAPVADTVLL